MSDLVTTILTGYRRLDILPHQAAAVERQSVGRQPIWLWTNGAEDLSASRSLQMSSVDRLCVSPFNWRFFARFALALTAETEFVAIMDDDSIPGRRWYENCLDTITDSPGILGTGGVTFVDAYTYDSEEQKAGWANPLGVATRVDFVGQSWFFRREWLRFFWAEDPVLWTNGEDMHFAYCAQRYGDIPSYCPPHPEGDYDLWGSTRPEIDADSRATSISDPNFWSERRTCFDGYRGRGWDLLNG